MLYLGRNIQSKEELKPISLEELAHCIMHDSLGLGPLSQHLRALLSIDRGIYSQKKKSLAYFCISQFKGHQRLTANFKSVEYVILDFDGISPAQIPHFTKLMTQDKRIVLCFISPSGEGLKVLFKLDKPLYDPKDFHDVAKAFGTAFSQEYELGSYFDQQTLDVTRATFIVPDSAAYYNLEAEPIEIEDYRHIWDSGLFNDLEEGPSETRGEIKKGEPAEDAYSKIKALLNQKKPQAPARHLSDSWQRFQIRLSDTLHPLDLGISELREIQFGIQVKVQHKAGAMGEANVYYGKKGYSVIASQKGNTDRALNKLLEELIWIVIKDNRYSIDDHGILRKV